MIDKATREKIISLIHREVVPALGCTEPIAVSLAVAKATELLGMQPEEINLGLSGNIIKNAMGVGIPGTGMIGLPIAIALGSLIGKSEYGLEVLKEVSPEAVERGKSFIESVPINIKHLPDSPSNLHVDVEVRAQGHSARAPDSAQKAKLEAARAVISREHTLFVLLEKDGEAIYVEEDGSGNGDAQDADDVQLNFRMVFDFATTTPLEEILFMKEAQRLNEEAAEFALKGDYGHSLGVMIRNNGMKYMGDSTLAHMVEFTSAACDARMGGATVPVMSNSGSGNQGITATLPVVVFAKDMNASEEQMIRALTLSHLTSVYIKQSLGRLSALCGCVVASTGASTAITWLMGGGYEDACAAVKNMVANLSGMLCDGAKPACSMKISSGVSTALMSAMLAMNGRCVSSIEGIVSEDVDQTIHNLTLIGKEAMVETDRQVLEIMTHK